MTIRPRRSVLYMPANNARAVEKAKALRVDAVVLDLEDSVAPDAKLAAREQAVAAIKAGGFGSREIFVRINAVGTPWAMEDLEAACRAGPDAVLVPKIADPELMEMIGKRLLDMHAAHHVRIWAMLETPMAILRAHEIAAMARDSETRLSGFVMGTNDLVKESHGRNVPGRAPMIPWLMHGIAAARAYGISILDSVYNDFRDTEGFRAECEQGRDMGFDGKTLIHPSQVEACNAAFSPAPEDIAEARRIIAAFDAPENKDKGVVQLDGRMVERLHADMARRTVAIAEAIGERET